MPNPEVSFPARYTPVNAVAFAKVDGETEVVSTATPLPVVAGALSAGSNHIGNVFIDDVADGISTTGTATANGVIVSSDMAGFGGGTFQVTSNGTGCTISYEQSNDGVTWVSLPVVPATTSNGAPVITTTAAGLFAFASSAGQVRARVSTFGSGAVTVILVLKRRPLNVNSSTSLAGGTTIGAVTVSGAVNPGLGYTDTMVALAASATYTGAGRASGQNQFAYFSVTAFADVAGTVFIEHSLDNAVSYQTIASAAVDAGTSPQLVVRITGAFTTFTLYRVRYVNGAAAQTTFRLSSAFTAR